MGNKKDESFMKPYKILYIGKHAILSYDEISLFTELGCKCFDLHGAYARPEGHETLPRPGIPRLEYMPDIHRMALDNPSLNDIPERLIDPFDIVIVTGGYHDIPVIKNNWEKFKKKIVLWRSIGQSTPETEVSLKPYKDQGMKVVRYSPKERLLPGYMGEDVVIRFYKDPNEWKDWNGNTKQVINVSQSLKGRAVFLHYQLMMDVMDGFPAKVYGTGNEDLGSLDGGNISYNRLKEVYRDSRVFLYAGTWPASYTLSFIEASMTGIPIVAIGKKLAEEIPGVNRTFEFYEVHDLIEHGEVGGYIGESVDELRAYVDLLLNDQALAKKLGDAGRFKAIAEFGKDKVLSDWRTFLASL